MTYGKLQFGATMWLVKVAILVLVVVCAVADEYECFYSLGIKYKLGSQSPQISLVNAPNIDCSYRIKAPFGTRIQVSCELSQVILFCDILNT